ncbi:FG-GAP repeat protein [Candidatus Sumerlaeota bacterium]|nr:FG-GAP repeat protein [Candidatus Sumerlaeota bacterium]
MTSSRLRFAPLLVAAAVIFRFAAISHAQTPGTLKITLNNPESEANARFGSSVAGTGTIALPIANVGAPLDNVGTNVDAGTVFTINTNNGALFYTIGNPAAFTADYFGNSAASSGNNIAVGTYSDDASAGNAGRAYVYDASSDTLLETLIVPGPILNDEFGWAVTWAGSNVVVGVPKKNASPSEFGVAYIYDGTVSGNNSTPLFTITNPTPQNTDYFGYSVAALGNNVLIGAPLDNTFATDAGSIYLYDGSTGSLVRTINNPNP